ncbi:MAG: OmpA family protein [Balneola sp.]
MSLDQTNNTKNSLYPKQEVENEDDDSWQVSYLDIITILLGFLIILLSFSDLNNGEPFSVSELFKSSVNETEFITTPIENIKEELENLLEPEIQQGKLEIFRELNDVRIRFKSDDLYSSGSAQLEDDASEILNRILAAFKLISYDDFEIDVEGHTDNVPISTSSFESNWELSTSRASNIVRYFKEKGISQERLKASGYADSRPLVEFDEQGNPYPASKDKNRRVVLRLFYSSPEQLSKAETDTVDTIQESTENELTQNAAISEPEPSEDLSSADLSNESTVQNEDNETTSTEEALAPTNEADETPVQNPVTTTTSKTSSKPEANTEITGNFENGCRYSVQAGSFESFNNSFNFSGEAEQKTGYKFEVLYNNASFSSRTAGSRSLTQTLALQKTIKEELGEDQIAAIVQQCYDNGRERPQALRYQIQLAFFQNEQSAIAFIETLSPEYDIEALIEQKSLQAYTVITPSIGDITTAQQRLSDIKNIESLNGAFIKFDPSTVSDYTFSYQIQLGSFSSKQEVDQLAERLTSEMNVQSSIRTFSNGDYYLLTRPYSDWDEIEEIYSVLESDSSELSPVLYMNERKL